MKRRPHDRRVHCLLIWMLSISGLGGCALWTPSKETIIRVQARMNPDKAKRLTIAGVKVLHHHKLGEEKIDIAAKKFIAAIKADQTYGPAHNNLGLLHFEQGNLYQAVLAFEQAMEYMPNDPATIYNLALTLESAGKVDQAQDLYYQAVQMDPVNPVFLGNLVRLKYRLGETGPELQQKLEDLILIETRPNWRRWADHLLAVELNPVLDRGPDPPNFDPDEDQKEAASDFEIEDRIIDLTPTPPQGFETNRNPTQTNNTGDRSGPSEPSELSAPRLSSPMMSEPLELPPEANGRPRPRRRNPTTIPQEPLPEQTRPSSRRTVPSQSIRDMAPIELSAPGVEGLNEQTDPPPTSPVDIDDLFDF